MKENNTTKIKRTKFKLEKTSKTKKYQLENEDEMHQLGFGKYAPDNKIGNGSM